MPADELPPEDPDGTLPKPWHKPQQKREEDTSPGAHGVDGGGTGDAIDAGVQGASFAGDVISGAGDLAAGAIEGAGELAGAAIEGAGGALEVAGGCAEGCGGCSLALLVLMFAAAGSALALFR